MDRTTPVSPSRPIPGGSWACVVLAGLVGSLTASAPGHGGPAAQAPTPEKPDEAPVRVTRLLSPDGRREAHSVFVVERGDAGTWKLVVAQADGSDRRALDVKLDGSGEVLWLGDDRLAYPTPTDSPRPRYQTPRAAAAVPKSAPSYTIVDLEGRAAGTIQLPDGCDPIYQALSPDGRRIAYCGRLATGREGKREHGLFVVEVATGEVRRIFPEAVKTLPAWSPDSKKLAIGGAGGYVKDYPLTVIDVETGQAEAVGCRGVGAAWSPDGRALAFTTEVVAGGSWLAGVPLDGRIGVWDLATKTLTLVSPPGLNVSDRETGRWELAGSHRPTWSPDGRRLAYRRTHSINGSPDHRKDEEVWVVGRDGTGARKVLDHEAEVAWLPDGETLLWLHEGRVGRIDADRPVATEAPPPPPIDTFTVTGTVVDEAGRPLPGVAMTVAQGMATLYRSEPVETDAQGRYTLRFGTGVISRDGVVPEPAFVTASKGGYYDKDFGLAGRLATAFQRPEGAAAGPFAAVVLPGRPYRLDFTMLPAVPVSGTLVDAERKPLPGMIVHLTGETPRGADATASGTTDDKGVFRIESVPPLPCRFSIGPGGVAIRSEPIPSPRVGDLRIILTYRALEAKLDWEVAGDER